jgi:hypothetical protein
MAKIECGEEIQGVPPTNEHHGTGMELDSGSSTALDEMVSATNHFYSSMMQFVDVMRNFSRSTKSPCFSAHRLGFKKSNRAILAIWVLI